MGFYTDRVLPHIVHVVCGAKDLAPLRDRVTAELTGDVVEVGFGSGSNVAHYPTTVRRVVAVEPSDVAWRIAGKRVGAAAVRIERSGLDGQSLPFPDASFDHALSTWTLCTIPNPVAALRELRRVLRPGGQLHFLEHGLAPDEPVRRWQWRFDPLQRRLAGGCHLSRPIASLITEGGFAITELDEFYQPHTLKFANSYYLGRAVPT